MAIRRRRRAVSTPAVRGCVGKRAWRYNARLMDTPDQLCSRILRTLWRHAPVNATYLGIHDYDHQLSAFDPDALDSQAAELRAHLAEIRACRAAFPDLDRNQRLDLDLLEGELL